LVYAKRKSDKSNKMIGVVISLDFTKLHKEVCKGKIFIELKKKILKKEY
jgi:hypothetical protein